MLKHEARASLENLMTDTITTRQLNAIKNGEAGRLYDSICLRNYSHSGFELDIKKATEAQDQPLAEMLTKERQTLKAEVDALKQKFYDLSGYSFDNLIVED